MTGDLLSLGQEIVSAASARGLTARLFGGVAVLAHCPSIETHPTLQRPHPDLDVMVEPGSWTGLRQLLETDGFKNTSGVPGRMSYARGEVQLDVYSVFYDDEHALDFSGRLETTTLTLPLADLLLIKLQRVKLEEKAVKDAIALLLDHRVTSEVEDEEQEINRERIQQVANQDWGLWTCVFDNTVELEKSLNHYIEPEEAQLVWRRIELLQEVLDGKGKSAGWRLRSLVGKRAKWYRETGGPSNEFDGSTKQSANASVGE